MSTMAVSSVRSSASFEEASQYGLERLGFSDLSLKDEQRSTSKHHRHHINKISQAEEVAHEIYDLCVYQALSSPLPGPFHACARAWGHMV